jgi:hypothetical protein
MKRAKCGTTKAMNSDDGDGDDLEAAAGAQNDVHDPDPDRGEGEDIALFSTRNVGSGIEDDLFRARRGRRRVE